MDYTSDKNLIFFAQNPNTFPSTTNLTRHKGNLQKVSLLSCVDCQMSHTVVVTMLLPNDLG